MRVQNKPKNLKPSSFLLDNTKKIKQILLEMYCLTGLKSGILEVEMTLLGEPIKFLMFKIILE
ncbi:MAG: hypothetical protein U0354_17365 [Candidatus Sericytochromatia bacterium]